MTTLGSMLGRLNDVTKPLTDAETRMYSRMPRRLRGIFKSDTRELRARGSRAMSTRSLSGY